MEDHPLVKDFEKMFDNAIAAKDKDFDSYVNYWMPIFGRAFEKTKDQ